MTDPTEFVLARIAEDEQAARMATPGPWLVVENYPESFIVNAAYPRDFNVAKESGTGDIRTADAHHIARHHPVRVLREVATKRALIAAVEDDPFDALGAEGAYEYLVLRALAEAYADHPDFRDEWRVAPP